MTDNFRIYLRYSDASHRLGGTADLSNTHLNVITKENIFKNFLRVFGTKNLTIMADNVTQKSIDRFRSLGVKRIFVTELGDRDSFRNMINLAIQDAKSDDDIVYFVEDDYIHCPDAEMYLKEGVAFGGYATLYDSLDKYIDSNNGGYNPFITDGGENTKVILSKHTHWKYTNATTNTFATTIRVLKRDYPIIMKYCSPEYPHPMDFLMFCDLWRNGALLVNCIPGRSAHVGLEMSPFVNWVELIEEQK